jgi:hypothetical protein
MDTDVLCDAMVMLDELPDETNLAYPVKVTLGQPPEILLSLNKRLHFSDLWKIQQSKRSVHVYPRRV